MVLRRACERRLVALGLSNEADLARLTECISEHRGRPIRSHLTSAAAAPSGVLAGRDGGAAGPSCYGGPATVRYRRTGAAAATIATVGHRCGSIVR
jgi:hypothetical protein